MAADNQTEGLAHTTKLAQRVWKFGGGVFAASFAGAQAQIPDWSWAFMGAAAVGAAAFCGGGLFLLLDGREAISRSNKKKEIVKRGWWLFVATTGFAAVAFVAFRYFPPAASLFRHPVALAPGGTAASPDTNASPPPPVFPGPIASTPTTPAPIASAPAASAPVTAAPVSPAPITSAPITSAPITSTPASPSLAPSPPAVAVPPASPPPEFVSLYGNTPRSLCGQPQMSARRSTSVRPSPTGWILYSTDYFSGFKEQPLAYGEPFRIGNCTLVLEGIDPELPRLDFKVIR